MIEIMSLVKAHEDEVPKQEIMQRNMLEKFSIRLSIDIHACCVRMALFLKSSCSSK